MRPPEFFTPEGQRSVLGSRLAQVERGLSAAWVITRGALVVGRVNLNNIAMGVLRSASVGYLLQRILHDDPI